MAGEKVQIPLLVSPESGFGYERQVGDSKGYNRTFGSIDARWPEQVKLGLYRKVFGSGSHDLTPVYATEWTATDGVDPIIYYFVGAKLMSLANGSVTEIGSNFIGGTATGGMFDDDGSGVPYLYMARGQSNNIRRMNRAGTLTTATGTLVATLLLSLNGKAYRTITPSGGTATCQVSTCPYGSDRFTSSNWGTGQTVGWAGTNINALISLRQAPVAIKPEGIYAYSEATDRWVNLTPLWERFPHVDNGKGAFSMGDLIVVPLGEGGCITFDGFTEKPFDPPNIETSPGVHTTSSKISVIGANRHWVVGITHPVNKLIMDDTLLVKKDATAENSPTTTTTVLNWNRNTTFSLASLTTSQAFYIGADRPFTGFRFDPGTTGTVNSTAATMTVEIKNAAGSWVEVTKVDFTSLSGASLGQAGEVVLTEDPIAAGWTKQVSGSQGSAFWMRVRFSAQLDASVNWAILTIQPWFPPCDSTNFPLDGLDRSGCYPHILMGDPSTNVWHDMGHIPTPDKIGVVLTANVGGTGKSTDRSIYLIGRNSTWQVNVAQNDRPGALVKVPLGASVSSSTVGGLLEGQSVVPGKDRPARLVSVKIEGQESDENIPLRFYYTWDWGKPWVKLGTATKFPSVIEAKDNNGGHRFRFCFGWVDSTAATFRSSQPTATKIIAEFEILSDTKTIQERQTTSVPRF